MKKSLFFLLIIFFFGKSFAQTELPNTISSADKVYGLSKFWNEVNYNFVYLNKIDRQKWDSDYKRLIEEVQNTKNDYEYYRLLQKFVASLKDGHTNIFFPSSFSKFMLNAEFGNYKFSFERIEGKVIITKINKSKKHEIPLGTEIIEVNNLSTDQYLAKHVNPYIAVSTKEFLKAFSVTQMFYQPKGTVFNIKFKKPNGKIISKELTISPVSEKEMYSKNKKEGIFNFKWLKNKTVYIALNSFQSSKIDSLFKSKLPEIKKAKGLVIDLRKNFGGSADYAFSILKNLIHDNKIVNAKSHYLSYNTLFNYYGTQYNLQAKDTIQGSPENIKLLSRAYLTARSSYFYVHPYNTIENKVKKDDRVVIPTAFLIGPFTASSSEDLLVAADNQKHMIKIGEATAGTTGLNIPFKLPGGGWARICIKKDTYPDGREFVGYGIQPDILVEKTVKDYLKNRDPVLQKAIQHLRKK
jgi:C-terminal processing protease CtpA/Prc